MALVRKLGFLRGSTRDLCTSDSDLVAADTTTDLDFTATIGRKADAAATGAVTTTDSLAGYIKQVVTLLLGSMVGTIHAISKAAASYTTAGVAVTTASTGGSILIKDITIQMTGAPGAGVTSVILYSSESPALNCVLRNDGGTTLATDTLGSGSQYVNAVNYILGVGGTLSIKTTGATLGNCKVTLTYVPLAEGAAVVAA